MSTTPTRVNPKHGSVTEAKQRFTDRLIESSSKRAKEHRQAYLDDLRAKIRTSDDDIAGHRQHPVFELHPHPSVNLNEIIRTSVQNESIYRRRGRVHDPRPSRDGDAHDQHGCHNPEHNHSYLSTADEREEHPDDIYFDLSNEDYLNVLLAVEQRLKNDPDYMAMEQESDHLLQSNTINHPPFTSSPPPGVHYPIGGDEMDEAPITSEECTTSPADFLHKLSGICFQHLFNARNPPQITVNPSSHLTPFTIQHRPQLENLSQMMGNDIQDETVIPLSFLLKSMSIQLYSQWMADRCAPIANLLPSHLTIPTDNEDSIQCPVCSNAAHFIVFSAELSFGGYQLGSRSFEVKQCMTIPTLTCSCGILVSLLALYTPIVQYLTLLESRQSATALMDIDVPTTLSLHSHFSAELSQSYLHHYERSMQTNQGVWASEQCQLMFGVSHLSKTTLDRYNTTIRYPEQSPISRHEALTFLAQCIPGESLNQQDDVQEANNSLPLYYPVLLFFLQQWWCHEASAHLSSNQSLQRNFQSTPVHQMIQDFMRQSMVISDTSTMEDIAPHALRVAIGKFLSKLYSFQTTCNACAFLAPIDL